MSSVIDPSQLPHRNAGRWAQRKFAAVDKARTQAVARATMSLHPIVIFSMGKTGTTSLTEALEESTGRPVMKAHALSRSGLAERYERSRELQIVDRPRFLWTCEEIARTLRHDDGRRWDLIAGVRDPIAQAVSDHFYGLRLQAELGIGEERQSDDPWVHAVEVEEILARRFLDVDWFVDELWAVTGINAYEHDFDRSLGCAEIGNERFRVLVIRSEDLPRVGPEAVRLFFTLGERPNIGHRNEGTADDTHSSYAEFLDAHTLAPEIVDRVYDTRLARHFYTDEERAEFRHRWTGEALVPPPEPEPRPGPWSDGGRSDER